ncbi:MAG: hypothetical protein N0E44_18220 [Candidatus Thiodiazotropha lotti]|nr:hypothetical protein [Candidatus Thiodiazotropha lotti]MCW4221820.1 hypothetical protein [Candidatus Thiodiazotropha lotti]
MSKLVLIPSDGIYPRRDPYDLPGQVNADDTGVTVRSAGVTAQNCDFRDGRLNPKKSLGGSVGIGNNSIYLNGADWLNWSGDVDVVRSPIESSDRIVYSGDGEPKIQDGSTVYPLGLPAPTSAPTVASQAKASFGFTITWHYYYEEPNGVREDADESAIYVTETTPGEVYTLATIPAPVAASADARFILWGELFDGSKYLGKVIPEPANDAPQTDAEYNGASITGTLEVTASAVVSLAYDTSRSSKYTTERAYYYCFVRKWGDGKIDLGPPGEVSTIIGIDPTEDANLTDIESAPAGYGITHIWIYRLAVAISGEDYQFVDEIAAGTTSYLDEIADENLGEVDPEYIYSAPPSDLTSLKAHPAGFLIGISQSLKSVCCSAIREIHAWPSISHRYALKDNPVAIELIGNTIVVTTDGDPVYIFGDEPDALSPPDRIPIKQANMAKRGTIFTGDAVIYPAPDGLVSVGQGSGTVLTNAYYTQEQWQALDPASMICAWHDRKIYVFHSAGCLIFRFDDGRVELTTTDDTADAVHVDAETDALYISRNGAIYQWGAGTSNRTALFHSGYIRYPSLKTFGAVKVFADGYPVMVRMYRKDKGTILKSLNNGNAAYLPRGSSAQEWEGFEIESAYSVDQVIFADSRGELL